MTAAQQLLKSILENRKKVVAEHNELNERVSKLKEHVVRIDGALEAFSLLGITLDEEQEDDA